MRRSLAALCALTFFMADVSDGLGPFLGVFLQSTGWSPSEIGIAMTAGGLAGVAATTPFGILVDATRYKRALVATAASIVVATSMVILFSPNLFVTVAAQIANGAAAAVIPPAIAAITLGLVKQGGFA